MSEFPNAVDAIMGVREILRTAQAQSDLAPDALVRVLSEAIDDAQSELTGALLAIEEAIGANMSVMASLCGDEEETHG